MYLDSIGVVCLSQFLSSLCLLLLTIFTVMTLIAGYLCPLEANIYNIEFTRFKLRDLDSQNVLFEVTKPTEEEIPDDLPPNAGRYVRYLFPPEFLQLKAVGAT